MPSEEPIIGLAPAPRPEFELQPRDAGVIGDVARPLSFCERLTNQLWLRRLAILVLLCVVWQLYASWLANPLMFPTFYDVAAAWWDATARGPLIERTLNTIRVLVIGYACGIALAAAFTTLAVSTQLGTELLSTLTAMFNPLPAVALLPLALLWFGLGIPAWFSSSSIPFCGRWRSTPIPASWP